MHSLDPTPDLQNQRLWAWGSAVSSPLGVILLPVKVENLGSRMMLSMCLVPDMVNGPHLQLDLYLETRIYTRIRHISIRHVSISVYIYISISI